MVKPKYSDSLSLYQGAFLVAGTRRATEEYLGGNMDFAVTLAVVSLVGVGFVQLLSVISWKQDEGIRELEIELKVKERLLNELS